MRRYKEFLAVFFIYLSLKFFVKFNNNPNFKVINAIVVLTGGKGRIQVGKKLLKTHKDIYLIISGANPGLSINFLKRKLGLNRKNVIIENRSKNTIENALEVKKIVKKFHLKNILLITSKSHMIRALIIFKLILPRNIKIFPYAVQDEVSFKKVFEENIKLIYFFIKFIS